MKTESIWANIGSDSHSVWATARILDCDSRTRTSREVVYVHDRSWHRDDTLGIDGLPRTQCLAQLVSKLPAWSCLRDGSTAQLLASAGPLGQNPVRLLQEGVVLNVFGVDDRITCKNNFLHRLRSICKSQRDSWRLVGKSHRKKERECVCYSDSINW